MAMFREEKKLVHKGAGEDFFVGYNCQIFEGNKFFIVFNCHDLVLLL
jgi:hypothetical protein